ncbi:MAG: hypothetical protein JWR35_3737, partial [Marmoricola sp.]|nr:hypothetical protein [Marmoricola sp.]
MTTTATETPRRAPRWMMLLPLIAFAAVAGLFF